MRREVRIGGPVYRAAETVNAAIDALAFLLTGEREYFWGVGGGATEAQRAHLEHKAARERGDMPWRDPPTDLPP